jgi:hypothetical protein
MTNRIIGSTHEHMVHDIARIFGLYSPTIYGEFLRKTAIRGQDNRSRYKALWDKGNADARETTHDFGTAVSRAFLKTREVRDPDRSLTENHATHDFSSDSCRHAWESSNNIRNWQMLSSEM